MECPLCNGELSALGFSPTEWQCMACSEGHATPIRFVGDKPSDLKEV